MVGTKREQVAVGKKKPENILRGVRLQLIRLEEDQAADLKL